MKNKGGLIFPVLIMLFGVYALLMTLGSGGEQVLLMTDHAIPRGLGMVFGLIGLVGGGVVLMTALSNRKIIAQTQTSHS